MKLCSAVCLLALAVLAVARVGWAGELSGIYLCPDDLRLVTGGEQRLQIFGVDSDGNEVPVSAPLVWTSDPRAGSVDSNGVFTAGSVPGLYPDAVTVSAPGVFPVTCSVEVCSPKLDGGYLFDKAWGRTTRSMVIDPADVAADAAGVVYVLHPSGHYVQRFSADGRLLGLIDLSAPVSGLPYGCGFHLALDADGNLYVLGFSEEPAMARFDSSGQCTGSWDLMVMSQANYFAVSPDGCFYILDDQSSLVSKVDASGHVVLTWGKYGTGNGEFRFPHDIAVGGDGFVYIADPLNSRIQKFDSSGNYLAQWQIGGTRPIHPQHVAADSAGSVYVSDGSRVFKCDSSGGNVVEWPQYYDPSVSSSIRELRAGRDGRIYIAKSRRILVAGTDGQLLAQISSYGRDNGLLLDACGLAPAPGGGVYYADRTSSRVQCFNSDGTFRVRWPVQAGGTMPFNACQNIAFDGGNRVYVVDQKSHGIQEFDAGGNFVAKWAPVPTPDAIAVAADRSGGVYVGAEYWGMTTSTAWVYRYDSLGLLTKKWRASSSDLDGLAVDPAGNVYTSGQSSDEVYRYDPLGQVTAVWDETTAGLRFWHPGALASDRDGNIYVAPEQYVAANQIIRFDASGKPVARFGKTSCGLAVDENGCVYATEDGGSLGSRVVRYLPALGSVAAAKALSDGDHATLQGKVVTAGTEDLGDCFYMESADRLSGIRVTGCSARRGEIVAVQGPMATDLGEREIQAESVVAQGRATLQPVGLTNAALGGGPSGNQEAVWGWRVVKDETGRMRRRWLPSVGLSNIGLLVRTWGAVASIADDLRSFVIDDGSGEDLKCILPAGVAAPAKGDYVCVTGISSCEPNSRGELVRALRVRDREDIRVVGQ